MADKKVTFRLVMEGGKTVEAQLVGVGRAGTKAMGDIDRASRQGGTGLQNVGFQVQDFAVQVGAGTSATQALGQQLPQLLSGFGLFGVLAGTAAAVLIPLAKYLFDIGESAVSATDAVNDLQQALGSLRAADKAASQSAKDLYDKYGNQSASAREVLAIERQIAQVQAERALARSGEATSSAFLSGGFEGLSGQEIASQVPAVASLMERLRELNAEMERLQTSDIADMASTGLRISLLSEEALAVELQIDSYRDLKNAVSDIATAYGVTESAAAALVVTASAVRDADNTEERVAATKALAVAIFDTTDGLKLSTDEAFNLYNSLLDTVTAGLELQSIDLASGIGAAAAEAATLSGNLAAAAVNAWNVVTARGEAAKKYSASVGMGRGAAPDMDPYGFRAQLNRDADAKARAAAVAAASGSTGTGTGSGGGAAQNDMLRAAERLYDQTRTEAEKYAAELANLDNLLSAGAIDQDLYNRGLDAAKDKYGEASTAAQFFNDMNVDLKSTILDMATGATDALDGVIDALKRAAAEALIFGTGPIASLFGLSGGGLFGGSSILSGLFGGARAKGGPVDPSKFFLVGENGPELFVPKSAGTIVPNGGAAGAAGGGVNVVVRLAGGLDGYVEGVAQGVAAQVTREALSQYDKAMPRRVQSIGRDPRRNG